MAEISYPFNAANANGGTSIVSETQWQQMAASWGGDRVHYTLTASSYDYGTLPFNPSVVNGRDVLISAGNAWVGGFYYQNTSTKTLTIADNSSSKGRKDLIVIRVNMANSAANIAVRQGTAAATPKEPYPVRSIGGIWEMPLVAVNVPANNGAITVSRRSPFRMPDPVSYPWNADESSWIGIANTFSYDLDSNGTDVQTERFHGADGHMTTRSLGKSTTYTPSVLRVSSVSSSYRKGRWRWIAPNTFWFQVTIDNKSSTGAMVTGSNWRAGVSLPVASNKKAIQVVHGYVSNPEKRNSMPNMMSVTATTEPGSSTLWLHIPNFNTPSEGLDGLRGFPGKSTFSISGVLESNKFSE